MPVHPLGEYCVRCMFHCLLQYVSQKADTYFCNPEFLFIISFQVVECPSIYEMQANARFSWAEQPELRIWIQDKPDEKAYLDISKPDTVNKTLADALRDNTVCWRLLL